MRYSISSLTFIVNVNIVAYRNRSLNSNSHLNAHDWRLAWKNCACFDQRLQGLPLRVTLGRFRIYIYENTSEINHNKISVGMSPVCQQTCDWFDIDSAISYFSEISCCFQSTDVCSPGAWFQHTEYDAVANFDPLPVVFIICILSIND